MKLSMLLYILAAQLIGGKQLRSKIKYLFLSILLIICSGCNRTTASGFTFQEQTESSGLETENDQPSFTEEHSENMQTLPASDRTEGNTDTSMILYIYVCGNVVNPGVYTCNSNARVCDLVEQAGGMTDEADICAVNQAQLVTDGMQIYIPAKGEIVNKNVDLGQQTAQDNGKVNLNSATKQELMSLPGIGETKAQSIIEYREQNQKFTDINDLKSIPGIKEGVFNNIKDFITV